ncbi:MAG: BsuPI-related putative proteinase inhibitor [Halanaerobium sp.]
MKYYIKILCLAIAVAALFSISVSAQIQVENRKLKYTPIVVNQHFLIPVEFLNEFLDFTVKVEKDLTMPYRDDIGDQSENNLRFRVYLNDDEFDSHEQLSLRFEIMNNGRDDVKLRFNSGQKYNIYIKNRFGRVLYSWADSKKFSQAVQNIEIKGRDSLKFEEEIKLTRFREGRHFVEVEITSDNYEFAQIEKEFEIDD